MYAWPWPRALAQLHAYYEGKLTDLGETDVVPSDAVKAGAAAPDGGLLKARRCRSILSNPR